MAPVIRWYRSLAWRFFLRTAAAIAAVMAMVLWVAYVQAHRGAVEAGARGLHAASQVLERQIPQEARLLDAGLEVFITQSANVTYLDESLRARHPESVQDYLAQSLGNLRADLAVLVALDGKRFAGTAQGDPEDYAGATIVQMALDPEEAAAAGRPGPSYAGYLDLPAGPQRGMYLAVARPVRLPGGNAIGAMVVGRRLGDAFAGALRDLAAGRMEPLTHLAILSGDTPMGATLPESRWPELGRVLQVPAFVAARQTVEQGQISDAFPVVLEGTRYLAALSPLRGEDGLTLAMGALVLIPLDPYFVPFQRLQRAILWTGLAALLLALLIALATARGVTRPLRALTRAAAALAEGGRPELPESEKADEVGLLTRAFRQLLSELRAKDELVSALAKLRPARSGSGSEELLAMPPVDIDATAPISGAPAPAPDLQALFRKGAVFAERYRVESVLGKGGMGVVLKAWDLRLEEHIALKVIQPQWAASPEFLEQLKQEIRLARRITHRNVLRTHDFGEASGIAFVTMEFLQGITLKQLLDDRGRLPLPMVLRIGRQVGEGLAAAHAEGVVHRDVKPLNVIFDARGDVKLLDFGLAAPVAASVTAGSGPQGGFILGTPRYMAPEQVRGERVDPRTDLYAFGVMLFELATGTAPYEHADLTELLGMHLRAPVPSVQARVQGLPASFARLVERLLAKPMDERPASAVEVVELLKLVASEDDATSAM